MKKEYIMNKKIKITDFVTKEDIDLIDKLSNMCESEISEYIFNKCHDSNIFLKIEKEIWSLMNNPKEEFYYANFYDGLEGEYEAENEKDLWSARLYNCDLIYMVAIAKVLGLKRPNSSYDVEIFGM